jgi:glycosyltransferase involved in cell wall biosynthesis
MKITVHTLVKNEDLWIWFAIQSVLPLVDQIIIFDTGSTDKTVDVIKTIKSSKIIFEEKGEVSRRGLVDLRREQIKRTKTDWFLILDGDEIWPKPELEKLLKLADSSSKDTLAIFNRVRNCIGDVHHYLPDSSGNYEIAGIKGNLNMRLIRKTPDLTIEGEYPLEAYTDKGDSIQDQAEKIKFADCWYLHTSFLKRSSVVKNKVSGSFGRSKIWQKGIKMDDLDLPEVLKLDYPKFIPSPIAKRGTSYELAAGLLHPLANLKRKIRQ